MKKKLIYFFILQPKILQSKLLQPTPLFQYPESNIQSWPNSFIGFCYLPSFQGYADYMETGSFINAIHQLEELAGQQPTAFMCSEVLWWRCHRSLVADWFKLKGWNVYHIFNNQKVEEHPYTEPAKVVNGRLLYN